jgi:YihY family inner membrane protein
MTTVTPQHTLGVDSATPRRAGHLAADVVRRFRHADGTSHTRALAYQVVLIALSGFIGLVGLASLLEMQEIRRLVQHLVSSVSPGPSGTLLQEAAQQGAEGGTLAAVVGLGTAWIAGTFAVAQVERSANRIMGLDHDRSTGPRYFIAAALAVPVGLLLTAGGLLIGAGSAVVNGFGLEDTGRLMWEVARWPVGLLLVGGGLLLLLRVAPSRRLSSSRQLLAGTAVSVVSWAAFTGLLSLYFAVSSSSSRTFGPLLAVIALLFWAGLTSLALHLGITTAVKLERS